MKVKILFIASWLYLFTNNLIAQIPSSCENALPVICDQIYSIGIEPEPVNYHAIEACGIYLSNPIWFSLEGSGEIIDLKICDQFSATYYLLSGTCNVFECQILNNSVVNYDCSYTFQSRFRTEAGIQYFIVVNPDYLDARIFTIQINCASAALNDECENASLISVGERVSIQGNAYTPSSDVCGFFQERGDAWFEFSGTGQPVVFNSTSFLTSGSFYEGDCDDPICLSPISVGYQTGYNTEVGRKYYLEVHVLGEEEYEFSLDEISVASNSLCENAEVLPVDTSFFVDFSDALSGSTPCRYDSGPLKYYRIFGNGNILNLSYANYTPSVFEGSCSEPICPTITLTNELSFPTRENVEYFVALRGDPYNPGEFYAYFSLDRAVNDSKEDASIIQCGDSLIASLVGALFDPVDNYTVEGPPDIWFEISGSNRYVTLENGFIAGDNTGSLIWEIFGSSDDHGLLQLPSFYFDDRIYVYLKSNTSYFVRVSGYTREAFYLKATCRDAALNDGCQSAISLLPGDTIEGANIFGAETTTDPCPYLNEDVQSDIWYSLEGDGKYYEFIFERAINGAQYALYQGSCTSLECIGSFPLYDYSERNALKVFLERGQIYYVKVFSSSSNSNDQHFLFYLREAEIATNDLPCTATILNCGDIIEDSTTNAINNDLLCDGSESGAAGVWYRIEGQNKYYELASNYEVEGDLVYALNPVLFSGTCNELKCESEKLYRYQNKFVFYGKKGITYYILFNDAIPVRLRFSCLDEPGNDSILKAKRITQGVTYQGYAFNARREDYAVCGSRSDALKDIWFRITGNDEFLFVNEGVDYLPVNSYLGEVYTKVSIFYKCTGSFDGNRFFLKKGVEYYIRLIIGDPVLVSGFSGDYEITFTTHPRIEVDDCVTAHDLICGEEIIVNTNYATDDIQNLCGEGGVGSKNIWFSVEGDDSFKEIIMEGSDGASTGNQVFIFTGSCDSLECLGPGNFIYAVSGNTYFFNVVSGGFAGELRISLRCLERAENDLCDRAAVISCGENVIGTFNNVLSCDYADPCDDFIQYKRVWYRFIGNGALINLKLNTTQFNSHLVRLRVFQGDCCNPDEIEYDYVPDPGLTGGAIQDLYFLSEEDKSYLIAVEQLFAIVESSEYTLSLQCLDPEQYALCDNAPYLENGALSFLDVGDYFTGSIYAPLSGLVRWRGTGSVDTLIITGGLDIYPTAYLNVISGDNCNGIKPISNSTAVEILRNEESVIYILPSKTETEYLIRINRQPNYISSTDLLPVVMLSGAGQNSCEIILPAEIELLSTTPSFNLPYQLSGVDYPVNVYLSEGLTGPTFYSTLNGPDDIIEIPNSFSPGLKVLELFNEQCRSYSIFQIIHTDLPDHICPDSIYCPQYIIHPNQPVPPSLYHADVRLESQGQILEGGQVIYQAGVEILLAPGFEVPVTATLEIRLGGCQTDSSQLKSVKK